MKPRHLPSNTPEQLKQYEVRASSTSLEQQNEHKP